MPLRQTLSLAIALALVAATVPAAATSPAPTTTAGGVPAALPVALPADAVIGDDDGSGASAVPAAEGEVVVTEVEVVLPAVDSDGDVVSTPEVDRARDEADTLVADEAAAADRVVTQVLETDGFQTLGVTWPAADEADLDIEVRTRSGEQWSGWRALEVADDAPDAGTPDAAGALRAGTDPVWVGEADAVQLSFGASAEAGPDDLGLTLVDVPLPTSVGSQGASVSTAGLVVPAAMTAAPRVITRAEWGARAQSCTPDVARTLVGVVVHHTAGSNDYATVAQAMQQIRGDQAYHMDGRGWCDLGYNFIVDKWGNVYEGRANSLTQPVIGVHAGGFNTSTVGISMLGNYSTITPGAAVQESVAQIAAWRLRQYNRDPGGTLTYTTLGGENSSYPAGSTATLPVIFAHRDVAYTACPGQAGYSTMGWLRARAQQLVSPGMVNPTVSPSSAAQGSTFTVRAATLGDITWQLEARDARTGVLVGTSSGTATQAGGGVVASWNGRNLSGVPVGTGPYALTITATGSGGQPVAPWTGTVQVTGSQNPPAVASVPLVGSLTFVPITPTRVLDTRTAALSLGPASRVDVAVAGVNGIPADARAVAVNVTAVHAAGTTHVRAWPAGQPRPETSVLNTDAGRSAAASGLVLGVGGEGKISLYNDAGSVHLVVDVTGYYVTGSTGEGYSPLGTAVRVLDTRVSGPRMVGGAVRRVPVAGAGGVPADATAVVVNVTSVMPSANGNLSLVPSGTVSQTSSVNHLPGRDVANRTTVQLSGGAFDVVAQGGQTDVVVDVVGWYGPGASATFTPMTPVRALDTRTTGTPLGERESRAVPLGAVSGLDPAATSVVMMLTTTQASSAATYLTAWPAGAAQPMTSDLNTVAGKDQANAVVVPIGAGRAISLYNNRGTVHAVADLYGYFR